MGSFASASACTVGVSHVASSSVPALMNEAITDTGSVLIRGLQDVSREWLELVQERLRKRDDEARAPTPSRRPAASGRARGARLPV
jgi:hypothetical protein